MGILSDLISALSGNSQTITSVQQYRLSESIRTQLWGQMQGTKDNDDKKTIGDKADGKVIKGRNDDIETLNYIVVAQEIDSIMKQKGMSETEKKLLEDCLRDIKLLKEKNLSPVKKAALEKSLQKRLKDFSITFDTHDKAIQDVRETHHNASEIARMILKDFKSPYYCSTGLEPNKSEDYYIGRSGAEDPIYDKFNELYGKKGILGFVDENPEASRNLSQKELKLAAKRYTKPAGLFNLLGLAGAGVVGILSPFLSQFVNLSPLLFGSIAISTITTSMALIENKRLQHNAKIAEARFKIAKDLGLVKGDFSGFDYMWDLKNGMLEEKE
jgi:hypothetical protein